MNIILREHYLNHVVPEYRKLKDCASDLQVPRIDKVCVNVGLGQAKFDDKLLSCAVRDISLIVGQKAVITYAHKSISSFKIREGFPVGCKVTLRKKGAYNFLERLLYVALPEERDFKGFSGKNFDGRGNFSFGIREHIIFPEINYDKIYKVIGMNVVIVTTVSNDKDAKLLLSLLNFPFYN